MKIGYIVSDKKIEIDNFINVHSLSEISEDLPVIVVGTDFLKKNGIKYSLLDKNIKKNWFWTFSEKEKKSEYRDDIENFKTYCLNHLTNKINYYYIDPFNVKFSHIKSIINLIQSKMDGVYYEYDGKMIYFLVNGVTFGLNLDVLSFLKIDKKKVLNFLEKFNVNSLPKNQIFIDCINLSDTINNKKIVPYLYLSSSNGKTNFISLIYH